MAAPVPPLLPPGGADAASVLPPLQWGWLALVAGLHAAGLALLLGSGGDSPARVPEEDRQPFSVSLLPAPQAPPATPPASPQATPVSETPPAPLPPPAPRQQAAAQRSAAAAHALETTPANPSPPAAQPADTRPPADSTETAPPAEPPGAQHAEPAAPATPGTQSAALAPAAPPELSPARFDAAYLHNPAPPYPAASRRRGEEGQVLLRVRVLASGRAAEVEIVESSRHPRLDQAARRAVADWRFEPARQGGSAVDSWLRVPVVFRLEGR